MLEQELSKVLETAQELRMPLEKKLATMQMLLQNLGLEGSPRKKLGLSHGTRQGRWLREAMVTELGLVKVHVPDQRLRKVLEKTLRLFQGMVPGQGLEV